jgi:hypothetical protein
MQAFSFFTIAHLFSTHRFDAPLKIDSGSTLFTLLW